PASAGFLSTSASSVDAGDASALVSVERFACNLEKVAKLKEKKPWLLVGARLASPLGVGSTPLNAFISFGTVSLAVVIPLSLMPEGVISVSIVVQLLKLFNFF